MPTYYARGVSASLATCDLHSTLTHSVKLTMGAETKRENQKFQDVFSKARKFSERTVAADGSTDGVLQFIGKDEDLPMYVVETGESIGYRLEKGKMEGGGSGIKAEAVETRQEDVLEASDDSPLTSLGDTPRSSGLSSYTGYAAATPKVLAPKRAQADMAQSLTNRLQMLGGNTEQALVLDIDLGFNAFLPSHTPNRKAGSASCRDLKIEIFLNGELADVRYVTSRVAKVAGMKESLRCTGTRVHRQVEKPWVYNSSSSAEHTAAAKWHAASDALAREAVSRGRNQLGNMPPSAEFLTALTSLALPSRFGSCHTLAVMDIVITAGRGNKYGPNTPYVLAPTRLDDPDYTIPTAVAPSNQDLDLFAGNGSALSPYFLGHQPVEGHAHSSPEVTLRQARMAQPGTPSPPKKNTKDLEAELGIGSTLNRILFDSYEKTSGHTRNSARTLKQRLGDIGKMSPSNQFKEMAKLRVELGSKEDGGSAKKKMKLEHNDDPFVEAGAPADNQDGRGRNKKKTKLDHATDLQLSSSRALIDAALFDNPFVISEAAAGNKQGEGSVKKKIRFEHAIDPQLSSPPALLPPQFAINDKPFVVDDAPVAEEDKTMSPADIFLNWPQHLAAPAPLATLDTDTDAGALLAQDRIDMALDAGVPSNSALLRRIADSTPSRTPPRKSIASALANSPTTTPVKPQTRQGPPKTPTPQRSRSALDGRDSPTPGSRKLGRTRTPGSCGANRTASKWIPGEQEWADGVKNFEPPPAFKGSCVTYAEDKGAQRQIMKARAGTFKEDTVLVGMRFIVV